MSTRAKGVRIKTKASDIVDYWRGRPDAFGFEPASYDPEMTVPACMVCGFSMTMLKQLLRESEPSLSNWNASGLDRGHLHSFALGGNDDASNLLMMCRECNRNRMPQFRSRESALRHLANARWVSECFWGTAVLYKNIRENNQSVIGLFSDLRRQREEQSNADETERKP